MGISDVTDVSEVSNFRPEFVLELARDKTEQGRRILSEEVSRIFESALSESERHIAAEILMTLICQAEVDLRQALAERLSVIDDVPEKLILTLSYDVIEVAGTVLKNSSVLSDMDLIEIIHAKDTSYWQSIAQRTKLSAHLVDSLVATGDSATALHLVSNDNLRFSRKSMKRMGIIAVDSEKLQAPLLQRPEVDNEMALSLYLLVSNELRKEILDTYNINAIDLDHAMQDIIDDMTRSLRQRFDVSRQMMGVAQQFAGRNEITSDLLIKTLRRGQVGFFIALFAQWLDVSPKFIRVLIEKEGGKHLAAACRAAGVLKSEFASIFLLSRSFRDEDKVVDQEELATALKNFDQINPAAAKRVLSAWSDGLDS